MSGIGAKTVGVVNGAEYRILSTERIRRVLAAMVPYP